MDLQRTVEQILERTGIGKQIEQQLETERAARFKALAKRKGDAISRFEAERTRCKAEFDAAEEKHKRAQRAAEQSLKEVIAAHGALSDCHGTIKVELEAIDPQMLECCDPRIAPFRREIESMLEVCPGLLRSWPDEKGRPSLGGGKVSDNRAAVDRRAMHLIELINEVDRLRLRHDIADVGKEIERLRGSIPGA